MSENDFSSWENPNKPKSPCIPHFYTEAIKMEFLSKQQGRPIFEDREFVRIVIPGDRRSMVVEPVNDEHKARWAQQYAAYKEGKEAPVDGTPLSEWAVSQMTKARAEELAYFHIKTVEQLADVNDAQLQNLGMGSFELRKLARTWLDIAKRGSAPIEQLQTANDRLTADVERMSREMAEMRALLQEQKAPANAGA